VLKLVLRSALGQLLYGTADRVGVNWALRKRRDDIAVLMYHGLVPDDSAVNAWTMVRVADFRRQMTYLRRHCEVLNLDHLVANGIDRVREPNNGKQRVLITFDDGYRSNYTYALPVLQELDLPATVFVATAFTDTRQSFWYDKVIYAVQQSGCTELDLREIGPRESGLGRFTLRTSNPAARWDDLQQVLTAFKTLDFDARERASEQIGPMLGVALGDLELFSALSSEDIRTMHRSGLISIGSHTHRHEILTQSSIADARSSIELSRQKLEGILQSPCRTFSYPNGDYSPALMQLLATLGLKYGFTTHKAFWAPGVDDYAIPRIGIGGYDSPSRFAALLSGLAH
jgi:peptidoglycan/xylan/chitin deacetylase (PgdA/CDA1 family)